MKLLEKILVPLDINTYCEEQINATIKLASKYKSEIILLYVVPDEGLKGEIKKIVTRSITESLNEQKELFVKHNLKVREPIIAYGKIIDNIVQKADSENVNLVIIGSNKKKVREKFKLGVIAEQIIRMSDVPVWLVNANNKSEFTHILCPVDFSKPSKRSLYNAILLARKFKSTLHVLTIYEPINYISKRLSIDIEKENTRRLKGIKNEMKEFINDFDLNGVKHKIEVASGVIHEKILTTIEKQHIDLLIMGTNGRTGLNRFFMGSITEKVIREMPCSFITMKDQNIIRLKLDNEINEIEVHFKNGEELIKNALYEKAIDQFLICLQVNDMHVPSMYKLAEIYTKLGNAQKSIYFERMAKEILSKIWDRKIEAEIRKHYRF